MTSFEERCEREDEEDRLDMIATVENMRLVEGPGVFALDPSTGDRFSATPGDYFWLGDGVLKGEDGDPLILVREERTYVSPRSKKNNQ